jgi:hypothetical protein
MQPDIVVKGRFPENRRALLALPLAFPPLRHQERHLPLPYQRIAV